MNDDILRGELELEFLMFSSCTPKRSLWALPGGRPLLLDLDGELVGGPVGRPRLQEAWSEAFGSTEFGLRQK